MKRYCYFLIILFLLSGQKPLIKSFYEGVHKGKSRNLDVLQGKDNLIYVANESGLLRYNGSEWLLSNTKSNDQIRSLAVNQDGKVYWGGYNSFGVVEKNGELVSISNKLIEKDKAFGSIFDCHSFEGNTYFRARKKLFLLKKDSIKTINLKFKTKRSFLINNELYIISTDYNLYKLYNNAFIKIAYPGRLLIIYMAKRGQNKIEVIASDGKVYELIDTQLKLTHTIKENTGISSVAKLSNGDWSIGNKDGGLSIYDQNYTFKYRLRKKDGLTNTGIWAQIVDKQGNLWATGSFGIYKIDFTSEFIFYNSNVLPSVTSINQLGSNYYIGTENGLYKSTRNGLLIDDIKQVPGSYKYWVFDILRVENELFVGDYYSLYKISNNKTKRLLNKRIYKLEFDKTDGYIYALSKGKLYILSKFKNEWKIRKTVHINDNYVIQNIAFDHTENVWLSTSSNGVIKIDKGVINSTAEKIEIEHYTKKDGLKSNSIHVFYDDSLRFLSYYGDHLYDRSTNKFTLINSEKIYPYISCKNYKIEIISDTDKIKYCNHFGSISRENKKTQYSYSNLKKLRQFYIQAVFFDGQRILIGTKNNGIIEYLPFQNTPQIIEKMKVHISCVKVLEDSVRYITRIDSLESKFKLFNGKITINYGLPFFVHEEKTQFKYRLKGYEEEFSEWSYNFKANYTSLWPGDYVFQVKAKNIFDHESEIKNYAFTVISPFYLSNIGIALYVILFVLIVFLISKLRYRTIIKYNLELEKKVKERTALLKRSTLLLNEKNEELEEMNRIKSNFFSNITHEFKTPLTLIITPLKHFIENETNSINKQTFVMMKNNCLKLLKKINQLLDLSSDKKIPSTLNYEISDINQLLEFTITNFSALAEEKQLTIDFNGNRLFMAIDKERILDVFTNILSNAIKYSVPNGIITVQLKHIKNEQNIAEILVSDTGIGISKTDLPFVFDRFYRVQHSSYIEGTGIGLAYSKHVVELHGGSIDIESEPDKGTNVRIQLPAEFEYFEKESNNGAELLNTTSKIELNVSNDLSNTNKRKLLIVEDNIDLVNFLKIELGKNYTILTATDGNTGLLIAYKEKPDLIISDVMMPEIDGITLCTIVKEDEKIQHIPIILLTAMGSKNNKTEGINSGADLYIEKPFDLSELKLHCENLISNREKIHQSYQKYFLVEGKDVSYDSIDEQFIKQFMEIVEENFSDPRLNIDSLCDKIGLSRSHFYTKILSLTNNSPKNIIRNFRLDRAKKMIESNTGTISEIAYQVGFNNVSHFTKIFKNAFGTTPTNYKKTAIST